MIHNNLNYGLAFGDLVFQKTMKLKSGTDATNFAELMANPPFFETIFNDFRDWFGNMLFFPVTVPDDGTDMYLTVGSYNTAGFTSGNREPIKVRQINQNRYFTLGEMLIPNDNFLHSNGYMKLMLYLPYYGITEVPYNEVAGKYLQIRLKLNYKTGEGLYVIGYSDNSIEYDITNPFPINMDDDVVIIKTISVKIGYEFALGESSIRDAQRNVLMGATKAATSILASYATSGMVTGTTKVTSTKSIQRPNPNTGRFKTQVKIKDTETRTHYSNNKPEAIRTLINSSTQALENYRVTGESDKPNDASLMSICPSRVIVYIYRPKYISQSQQYYKLFGAPLNATMSFSTLRGYTEIGDVHIENIPNILNEEKEMLENILSGGVIFPDGDGVVNSITVKNYYNEVVDTYTFTGSITYAQLAEQYSNLRVINNYIAYEYDNGWYNLQYGLGRDIPSTDIVTPNSVIYAPISRINPEPEPTTQTLIVRNSNNENEYAEFDMPYGYTFEQFIGSDYDESGGKFTVDDFIYYDGSILSRFTDFTSGYVTPSDIASGVLYYRGDTPTPDTQTLRVENYNNTEEFTEYTMPFNTLWSEFVTEQTDSGNTSFTIVDGFVKYNGLALWSDVSGVVQVNENAVAVGTVYYIPTIDPEYQTFTVINIRDISQRMTYTVPREYTFELIAHTSPDLAPDITIYYGAGVFYITFKLYRDINLTTPASISDNAEGEFYYDGDLYHILEKSYTSKTNVVNSPDMTIPFSFNYTTNSETYYANKLIFDNTLQRTRIIYESPYGTTRFVAYDNFIWNVNTLKVTTTSGGMTKEYYDAFFNVYEPLHGGGSN